MGKTWTRRGEKSGGKSRRHSGSGFFGILEGGAPPPRFGQKRHFEEKPEMITGEAETGTVTKFANGFGFIRRDNGGRDAFVHYSQIRGDGYRKLDEGARVRFVVERGPKGIQAVNVVELLKTQLNDEGAWRLANAN